MNGRSIGFRRFLKTLASDLVENAKPLLPSLGDKEPLVAKWLDGLALFAHSDQITEGQRKRHYENRYGSVKKAAIRLRAWPIPKNS